MRFKIQQNIRKYQAELEGLEELLSYYYLSPLEFEKKLSKYHNLKVKPRLLRYSYPLSVLKLCSKYSITPFKTLEQTLYAIRAKVKKKLLGARAALQKPITVKKKLNEVVTLNFRLSKGRITFEDHKVGRNGKSNYELFLYSKKFQPVHYYHSKVPGGGLVTGKTLDQKKGGFLALLCSKNAKTNQSIEGEVVYSQEVYALNNQGTFRFNNPKTLQCSLREYNLCFEVKKDSTEVSFSHYSVPRKKLTFGYCLKTDKKRFAELKVLIEEKAISVNFLERVVPPYLDLKLLL